MTETGRGAWTTIGGTTPYYTLTTPTNEGSQIYSNTSLDPNSDNYRAVNFAVRAIQTRINHLGYSPALVVDGWLGPASLAGIKWVQGHLGLTPDGEIGQVTAKSLFKPVIVSAESFYGIPGHYLGGISVHESQLDPGAVGYYTPDDKGLFQFNLASSGMTAAQAFDPNYAASHAASRFATAWSRYSGKGSTLQRDCSIAQHNSPLWADEWYQSGTAPNVTIENYVLAVVNLAASF